MTASTTKPEEQWAAPGAQLLSLNNGADNLTGVLLAARALCGHVSALARQQQSDCKLVQLAGAPYILYFLRNGDAQRCDDASSSPPPARARNSLIVRAEIRTGESPASGVTIDR